MKKKDFEGLSEHELLSLLRIGSENAFEQLYLLYSPKIYLKLVQLLKQEALAEELLQDVFVKVWEKREGIDLEKSFRAYLYQIAHNLVKDLFRRFAFDRKMLESLINESIQWYNPHEEAQQASFHKEILQQAINTLPAQRKRVYSLVKIEGKSYDEVSALLNISPSTVSDHIVKATKTLKTYFDSNDVMTAMLIAALIASY